MFRVSLHAAGEAQGPCLCTSPVLREASRRAACMLCRQIICCCWAGHISPASAAHDLRRLLSWRCPAAGSALVAAGQVPLAVGSRVELARDGGPLRHRLLHRTVEACAKGGGGAGWSVRKVGAWTDGRQGALLCWCGHCCAGVFTKPHSFTWAVGMHQAARGAIQGVVCAEGGGRGAGGGMGGAQGRQGRTPTRIQCSCSWRRRCVRRGAWAPPAHASVRPSPADLT